jgi:ubiquinone/menaquinone biosynthesis C-methylase UbiE
MSIIGSVLGRFSELELSTADEKHYTLKTGHLSKLALRLIGLPHLGFRGRARIIVREALRHSDPHSRILDAGCGYGIYSLSLADNGRQTISSIDLTPERIAALERMKLEQPTLMGPISLEVGSVTNLPFGDNTFDLVICSEVIEHVPDDHEAARELLRVTKAGGTMIISTPYNSRYNQRIYKKFGHERPGYTAEGYRDLFGRDNVRITKACYYEYALGTKLFNGFNAIRSLPLMGLLFYPFYALYRLDALMKIGEPNGIVTVIEKVLK